MPRERRPPRPHPRHSGGILGWIRAREVGGRRSACRDAEVANFISLIRDEATGHFACRDLVRRALGPPGAAISCGRRREDKRATACSERTRRRREPPPRRGGRASPWRCTQHSPYPRASWRWITQASIGNCSARERQRGARVARTLDSALAGVGWISRKGRGGASGGAGRSRGAGESGARCRDHKAARKSYLNIIVPTLR